MLREYKKDFNVENKKEYQSKKVFSKILMPTLIFGILSLVFMIFTIVGISSFGSGGGMSAMAIEMLGLPLLSVTVALFILMLTRFKKKNKVKGDKPFNIINKSQLGVGIATFALLFAYAGIFSASMFVEANASNYVNEAGYYAIKEGVNTSEYDRMMGKEDTDQFNALLEYSDTFNNRFMGVGAMLQKDDPTADEEVKIEEFKVFCDEAVDYINSYIDKNYCVVTADKNALFNYVSSHVEGKERGAIFTNVKTFDEFMADDIQLLNLSPVQITLYFASDSPISGNYAYKYSNRSYNSEGEHTTYYAYDFYKDIVYINSSYAYSLIQASHGSQEHGLIINGDKIESFYPSCAPIDSGESYYEKYNALSSLFQIDFYASKFEQIKEDRTSLKNYVNNESWKMQELDGGNDRSSIAAYKALNTISEVAKYLLIVASVTNVLLIGALVVLTSLDLSKQDYGKSLKTFKNQCDYLTDANAYASVDKLLKDDEFDEAAKEASALQDKYVAQRKIDIENSHLFVKTLNLEEDSKFDGNVWQLFGWTILGNLVAFVTLGILYPVKVAWVEGWKINHRSINGKQLHFDGNGFQLLGRYILWWLLSVVTLGIYTIFLPKKIQQWLTSHTHFVNLEEETEENRKLFIDNGITSESKFEGKILALLGWRILGNLVTIFTFGILYTVKLAWIQGWRINGQVINGLKVRFDGNGFQLLGKYILWWLLSIVTLGIYAIFVPVKIEKWISKHTHFEKVVVDETI